MSFLSQGPDTAWMAVDKAKMQDGSYYLPPDRVLWLGEPDCMDPPTDSCHTPTAFKSNMLRRIAENCCCSSHARDSCSVEHP